MISRELDVRRADGAADASLLACPDTNIGHRSHRRIEAWLVS